MNLSKQLTSDDMSGWNLTTLRNEISYDGHELAFNS